MANKFPSGYNFPAVGFYYEVSIGGSSGASAAFQEVSGMEVSVDIETVSEAGLNEYVHRLPKKTQYNNLVLKRGLMSDDSRLQRWLEESMQEGLYWSVKPKDVLVTLYDEENNKVMAWNFVKAYPVKWSASGLNSMESAVVIENIELSYAYWSFA
jgi:phage tail-like protein